MRVTRVFSIVLILFLVLGFAAGIIWVLDFFAIININKSLQNIPMVGSIIHQSDGDKDKIKKPLKLDKTPAEKENDALRGQNQKLTDDMSKLKSQYGVVSRQVELLTKEKEGLVADKNNLSQTLDSVQNDKSAQDAQKLSYEKLANYYGEMKPQAAVKIMDNLSDEVVIGILQNLEDDQVAKILSAMDPRRAATLVDKMKQ